MENKIARWSGSVIALLLLSGCASVSETYGPDGKKAYNLACSGAARDWGMCLSKAGELCGTKGYTIINVNGDSGVMATADPQQFFGGTIITRNMLITCK